MKNYIQRTTLLFLILNSSILSCQETIKTRTEDEIRPIELTGELKELQQRSTIYFKFDAKCFQRKEKTTDGYGKVITYYYELSPQKNIVLRHSTYKDFDSFENDEKMIKKELSNKDLKSITVIDINFILDNGFKETYFTIRDKKYFLIDESLLQQEKNKFRAYEVVLNSSYNF